MNRSNNFLKSLTMILVLLSIAVMTYAGGSPCQKDGCGCKSFVGGWACETCGHESLDHHKM